MATSFFHIKIGDSVQRQMGVGGPIMELQVTGIDDDLIHCAFGPNPDAEGWKFNREYGYEVDEGLGWGVPKIGSDGKQEIITGTFLLETSV